MIKITHKNFDLEEEYKKICSKNNGAYSFFLGTVRQDINDRYNGIFLECYEDLAYSQLNKIKEDSIKNGIYLTVQLFIELEIFAYQKKLF